MWTRYRQTGERHWIYTIVGFVVLLIAGVLLVLFTYDALSSPLVVVVAVLIPAGISAGVMAKTYPQFEIPYLIFAVIGLLTIAATRALGPPSLATIVLIIVHTVAGLTIFFMPISAVTRNRAGSGFLWVTAGGALIGLGGIALAFLKTGRQFLFFSADFVFAILAPLLLLMTLAFTAGFISLRDGSHQQGIGEAY
jgi:hypothetical protein